MLSNAKSKPPMAVPPKYLYCIPAAKAINQIVIPQSPVVLKLGWARIPKSTRTKTPNQDNRIPQESFSHFPNRVALCKIKKGLINSDGWIGIGPMDIHLAASKAFFPNPGINVRKINIRKNIKNQ